MALSLLADPSKPSLLLGRELWLWRDTCKELVQAPDLIPLYLGANALAVWP